VGPRATRRNPPPTAVAEALRDGLRVAASDPRLSDLPAVMTDEGRPLLIYRGTQRADLGGVRPALSFTSSLGVALIWSAVPADPFSSARESRVPRFLPTSSVHAVHLAMRRPLAWDGLSLSLREVLRSLRYGEPEGITAEEVGKVYNYLQNRWRGKAPGGPFSFKVVDDDGDEVPEDEGLDFSGRSAIIDERDLFADTESADDAAHLIADAFVFADAPAVHRAAARLGYDGIIHDDVFAGGSSAAPVLLGVPLDDVEGVDEEPDLREEWVPSHRTWRPFSADQVVLVARLPSADALALWSAGRRRSNPGRPAASGPLAGADWMELPAGTVLHHGTATAEDFAVPRGPAWFSDGPKVAERFARGSSVRPRVLSYRTERPLRLLRLGGWPDLYALGDRIWPGWSDREEQDPREVASYLCERGLDGWWLDDGDYGVHGADVMLCRPRDVLGAAFAARDLPRARTSKRTGSRR
jgi:hypothetical protein